MDKKNVFIKVFILGLIVIGSAFYVYNDYSLSEKVLENKSLEDTVSTLKEDNTSRTTGTGDEINKETIEKEEITKIKPNISGTGFSDGNSTYEDRRISLKTQMPNLDKAWLIPDSYSDEARTILQKKKQELIESLKNDPYQFDKWIHLGGLRKMIGDFGEAKNIWEFAANSWPDSILSHHNLGDLYFSYLKDYIKAEENMLKVIDIDPLYETEYRSLYTLYKIMYGENSLQATGILIRGLKSNSGSVDLNILLASHYKTVGEKENARKYYEEALLLARKLGNDNLQKAIGDELKSL